MNMRYHWYHVFYGFSSLSSLRQAPRHPAPKAQQSTLNVCGFLEDSKQSIHMCEYSPRGVLQFESDASIANILIFTAFSANTIFPQVSWFFRLRPSPAQSPSQWSGSDTSKDVNNQNYHFAFFVGSQSYQTSSTIANIINNFQAFCFGFILLPNVWTFSKFLSVPATILF